ncbi:MAG TPA: Rho termination factor N-terminal domain-containing protein, partial [Cellulomonas sp.]
MTDTIESTGNANTGGSARGAAISTLRLPELQVLAAQLGVAGTSKMRKSDLMDAIKTKRGGGRAETAAPTAAARSTVEHADAPVAQRTAPAVVRAERVQTERVQPERTQTERVQPERTQPERTPDVRLAPGET